MDCKPNTSPFRVTSSNYKHSQQKPNTSTHSLSPPSRTKRATVPICTRHLIQSESNGNPFGIFIPCTQSEFVRQIKLARWRHVLLFARYEGDNLYPPACKCFTPLIKERYQITMLSSINQILQLAAFITFIDFFISQLAGLHHLYCSEDEGQRR